MAKQPKDRKPAAKTTKKKTTTQKPRKAPAITLEQRLKDQIAHLRKEVRTLSRDKIRTEDVRKEIFGLARHTPAPPGWLVDVPHKDGAMVPVLNCSDWHWGEVVKGPQVSGYNEFNREIGIKRIKRLMQKLFGICFSRFAGVHYPGIVINLGGDMITGGIHPELEKTNEGEDHEVLLDLLDILIFFISDIAAMFPAVHVACVHGNHGRTGKKAQHKDSAATNYDWLLYCLLEKYFKRDPKLKKTVSFQITEGIDVRYKVFNTVHLLTHGDNLGVRGGDGIIGTIGPIMRGDTKIRTLAGALGIEYDFLQLGHFHQYMLLPGFRGLVNGSLIGFNEYAHNSRFRPEPPTQALHFVEPEGIRWAAPIILEKQEIKDPDADWIAIPKGDA